jgi:hypothetical protein
MDAWIGKARTDPGTALQILTMLSYGCRTQTSFRRERWYLINLGIPGEFLPERLDAVRPTCGPQIRSGQVGWRVVRT